jgi:acyl carrier protein
MSIETLKKIFSETLEIPPSEVNETLVYGLTKSWDSVAHMALIAAIESSFDLLIDTNDVIDMSSYSKALEILHNYGVRL